MVKMVCVEAYPSNEVLTSSRATEIWKVSQEAVVVICDRP